MLGGQNYVVYVTFLRDVACQKLLNSANVSRSYSQNKTGTVFLRHGVEMETLKQILTLDWQNQQQSFDDLTTCGDPAHLA